MKIGILTLPLHTNYGGILQAYALQTILERMGHRVEVFQHDSPKSLPWKQRPKEYAKRIVKKYILKQKNVHICEEKWWNSIGKLTTSQYTQKFIDANIHLRHIDTFSDILPTDYDAIVVGSDQVWRSIYFTSMFKADINNAYLGFSVDWRLKRVAYAPSFGTDNWEYTVQETEACGILLKKFDAVSVREQSAISICLEKFGVDALHVLDPTFLLSVSDYIHLFEKVHTPKSSGCLLCYILDQTSEKQQLIDAIAKEEELQPFKINAKDRSINASIEERTQPPVEQWLRGFYDAEYVVTDSFHACVFSIIFRKQFVVYGNEGRGMARFHSLLSLFGLETRLVYNFNQYIELPPIDYSQVAERLIDMQKRSMDFLQQGLS